MTPKVILAHRSCQRSIRISALQADGCGLSNINTVVCTGLYWSVTLTALGAAAGGSCYPHVLQEIGYEQGKESKLKPLWTLGPLEISLEKHKGQLSFLYGNLTGKGKTTMLKEQVSVFASCIPLLRSGINLVRYSRMGPGKLDVTK